MMIKKANRLDGIGNYYFADKLKQIRQMEMGGLDVINLGIGSPDLSPHPSVIEAMNEAVFEQNAHQYQPYRSILPLREAIKKWYLEKYNVNLSSLQQILPLIGSKEGIMHIAMTYLQDGDIAMVPNPGYPSYASASKIAGAELFYYNLMEENDWLPDIDQLNPNAKILWLNYPHMPTGAKIPTDKLKEIVDFAKKNNILIIHDNPYSFIGNDKPESIFNIPGALDVALELNSLSKSHNMAGWRLGMVIGKEKYIDDILKFKTNMDSGMFYGLQMGAIQALSLDESWYCGLNEVYNARRLRIENIVHHLGCSFIPHQVGLFVWCLKPSKFDSGFAFSDYLLDKYKMFVTPGGVFGDNGDDYVRFSLCNDDNVIEKLEKRLGL